MPLELFKEFILDNVPAFLELLNEWFQLETMPSDLTLARAALILKRGKATDCGNYRPILFLSSSYNIVASIIQQRINKTLGLYLHKLQFGF